MILYFFKNPTTSGQAPHDLSKEHNHQWNIFKRKNKKFTSARGAKLLLFFEKTKSSYLNKMFFEKTQWACEELNSSHN